MASVSSGSDRPVWLTDEYPELRAAPPWVMEEMVASQPGLIAPIFASSKVAGTRPARSRRR